MTMKNKQSFLLFFFFASIKLSEEHEIGSKGTQQQSFTQSYSSSSASAHASAYSSSNSFSYGGSIADLPIIGPIPKGEASRSFESQGVVSGDAILYPDSWQQKRNDGKPVDITPGKTTYSNSQHVITEDKTTSNSGVIKNLQPDNGGYYSIDQSESYSKPKEKLAPICCKRLFPGPDGSIHDYKVASESKNSHNSGYSGSISSVPYAEPQNPAPVKTCCKGPFPGPNGSIYDFKPASAVGTNVKTYHQPQTTTEKYYENQQSAGSYSNRKIDTSGGTYQTHYMSSSCNLQGNCRHPPPDQFLQPPFTEEKPVTENVIEKNVNQKPGSYETILATFTKPNSKVVTESTPSGYGGTYIRKNDDFSSSQDHHHARTFQEKVVGLREGPQGSPFGFSTVTRKPSRDDATIFIDLEKIVPEGGALVISDTDLQKDVGGYKTDQVSYGRKGQSISPTLSTYSTKTISRPCPIPGCGTSYRTYSNAVPSTGTKGYTIQIKTLPVYVSGSTYTNDGVGHSGFYSTDSTKNKIENILYSGDNSGSNGNRAYGDGVSQEKGSWNEGKLMGSSSGGYGGHFSSSYNSNGGAKAVAYASAGSGAYSNANSQASSSSYSSYSS